MENQTSFNNPSENLNNKPKKRRVTWIIIASIIILVALFLFFGGYSGIKEFYDSWQESKLLGEAMKKTIEARDQYFKVLAEDTYGGKTPQETLDMFIDALEKGDIELAGKYFALDDNLSRQELVDGLNGAIQAGRLREMLEFLKSAEKSSGDYCDNITCQFVTWNSDKTLIERTIYLKFNDYSKVWKINGF